MADDWGEHGEHWDMVTIKVAGLRVTVNRICQRRFTGFLTDLIELHQYRPEIIYGYNDRMIAGTTTWSNHAYGAAIDIDPELNPFTSMGMHTIPDDIVPTCRKWGIGWGGEWSGAKDYMHFEIIGAPASTAAAYLNADPKSELETGTGGAGGAGSTFAAGSDNVADAPPIGFGESAPTLNITFTKEANEPYTGYTGQRFRSAWWKFTAEQDGWVSVDSHKSTTTYVDADGVVKPPWTSLGIYIEGPPNPDVYGVQGESGTLYPYAAGTWSITADGEWRMDPQYGLQHPAVDTSHVYFLADAGLTYYIQLGQWREPPEDAPTTYVLTVQQVIPKPVEITVPVVGPFYDDPADQYMTAHPVIVGGDTALLRNSAGYIEFPTAFENNSAEESRVGGWIKGLAGEPGWPPPPHAMVPGWGGNNSMNVQLTLRFHGRYNDDRPLNNVPLSMPLPLSPPLTWQGNSGGVYRFNYGAERDPGTWNGTEWVSNGGWVYNNATSSYERVGEPVSQDQVHQMHHWTPSEEFLSTGDTRTIKPATDGPNAWIAWMGDWTTPPYSEDDANASLYSVNPVDYHVWFSPMDGQRLSDGLEIALVGWGLRIEWAEAIIRWVTFEDPPGSTHPDTHPDKSIDGKQTGAQRRFW